MPSHTHGFAGVGSQGVSSGLDNAAENSPRTSETTLPTGGGGAHENMQPTIFIGKTFIFAAEQTINVYPNA